MEETIVTTKTETTTTNRSTVDDEVLLITSSQTSDRGNESVELDVKTQIPIEKETFNLPQLGIKTGTEAIVSDKSKESKAEAPKKVKAKKLEKPEKTAKKKSNVSCFACKSKKAHKEEKNVQPEAKVTAAAIVDINESQATQLDASKVNLLSCNSSEESSQKLKSAQSGHLTFHGLDPLPNTLQDKTVDIPSICSVEMHKSVSTKQHAQTTNNSEAGDAASIAFYKESEQTPSMIGSTSIELPNVATSLIDTQINSTCEKTEVRVEQELPALSVETDKVIVSPDLSQKNEKVEVQKLSDDVVVLPDAAEQAKNE